MLPRDTEGVNCLSKGLNLIRYVCQFAYLCVIQLSQPLLDMQIY